MKDIGELVGVWREAAETDGIPPEVNEEERIAMARLVRQIEKDLGNIHAWPILGMTHEAEGRRAELAEKRRELYSILSETFPGGVVATTEAVSDYVEEIKRSDRRSVSGWVRGVLRGFGKIK